MIVFRVQSRKYPHHGPHQNNVIDGSLCTRRKRPLIQEELPRLSSLHKIFKEDCIRFGCPTLNALYNWMMPELATEKLSANYEIVILRITPKGEQNAIVTRKQVAFSKMDAKIIGRIRIKVILKIAQRYGWKWSDGYEDY